VKGISAAVRRLGQRLLHQQCWNWGRDIVRPEGNLLLEAGFSRQRAPEGETGSSRYELATDEGGVVLLWGFGLYFGDAANGGIYLNRYQFQPEWLPLERVRPPLWRPDMVPKGQKPPSARLPLDLASRAALQIADYEEWVLLRCGLEYRRRVLCEWKQAAKGLPPQTLPQSWRDLAGDLAASAQSPAIQTTTVKAIA
jgi:hypothetical protein